MEYTTVSVVFLSLASFLVRTTSQAENKRLIVLSLDGFRWDYLNGRASTPTFDRLRARGVWARRGLKNEFVTNTLPNHFSLVTGLHVEEHGIVDNFMHDAATGRDFVPKYHDHGSVNHPDWHRGVGEPIWVTNQIQNQSARSGVIMWMGGEVEIKGQRPSRHVPMDYAWPDQRKVDTLVDWLTDPREPVNLVLVHFPEPDETAHKYGPDSPEVTAAIEDKDRTLAYLMTRLSVAGLDQSTDVIVTSDHGFVTTSRDKLIRLDQIASPAWWRVSNKLPGTTAALMPRPGKENDLYEALRAASESGAPFTVYRKQDIPERFHYRSNGRIPAIFAMAHPGYHFVDAHTTDKFQYAGNHGYDNSLPEMHPFFVATGPSFRQGYQVETFRTADVYPLMCLVLGLKPAPNNGSLEVVETLLKPAIFARQNGWSWPRLVFAMTTLLVGSFIYMTLHGKKNKVS